VLAFPLQAYGDELMGY